MVTVQRVTTHTFAFVPSLTADDAHMERFSSNAPLKWASLGCEIRNTGGLGTFTSSSAQKWHSQDPPSRKPEQQCGFL